MHKGKSVPSTTNRTNTIKSERHPLHFWQDLLYIADVRACKRATETKGARKDRELKFASQDLLGVIVPVNQTRNARNVFADKQILLPRVFNCFHQVYEVPWIKYVMWHSDPTMPWICQFLTCLSKNGILDQRTGIVTKPFSKMTNPAKKCNWVYCSLSVLKAVLSQLLQLLKTMIELSVIMVCGSSIKANSETNSAPELTFCMTHTI